MHTKINSNQKKKTFKPLISSENVAEETKKTGGICYFPGGIYIKNGLDLPESAINTLYQVLRGESKSARLEKIHHEDHVYSVRVNDEGRLIAYSAEHNNLTAFFVVFFYDKHQYDKLKFVNSSEFKDPVIDLNHQNKETSLIQQEIKHKRTKQKNDWREVNYIDNQTICFSAKQQALINSFQSTQNTSLPAIVIGAGGCGKTLVIIKIFHQLMTQKQEPQNYIYIASTELLARETERIFHQLVQDNPHKPLNDSTLSFVSNEQFIKDHKPENQTLTYREDLLDWLNKRPKKSLSSVLQRLLKSPDTLIEEFKIAATMSEEKYVQLGEQQSSYDSVEDRAQCYKLYQNYKQNNPNSCQFLFPTLEIKKKLDLIIIDEGQNFPISQLLPITECAVPGQFIVCGDPLQTVSNHISIFPQLKEMMKQKYKQENPFIQLQTMFRNPNPVIEFDQKVIQLRRKINGGVHDKHEELDLSPAHPEASKTLEAPVEWIYKLDKSKIEDLTKLLHQPDTMLIAGDLASLKQAQKLFNNPLILLPDQVQGLQALTVVIFCLFPENVIPKINSLLKKLNETNSNRDYRNQPSGRSGTSEFNNHLSRLYTAGTRVAPKGQLKIYMGEYKAHHSELFFSELKSDEPKGLENTANNTAAECKPTNDNIPAESTPAPSKNWEEWITKLYRSGNEQEARQLYLAHVSQDKTKLKHFIDGLTPAKKNPVGNRPNNSNSKKTNTNTKNIESKTKAVTTSPKNSEIKVVSHNTQSSFFKVPVTNAEAGKITTNKVQFSKADAFIHSLITPCNYQKLSVVFFNPKAKEYLFRTYQPQDGSDKCTLFETLIENPDHISHLISLLRDYPFATKSIVDGAPLKFLVKTVERSIHTGALFGLLNMLAEQHPQFILDLSLDELNYFVNVYFNESLTLLEKIADLKPDILLSILQHNSQSQDSVYNNVWLIKLLKSNTGCAIIGILFSIEPGVFDCITSDQLMGEMAQINEGEKSLFHTLISTAIGQKMFSHLVTRHTKIKSMTEMEQSFCTVPPLYLPFDFSPYGKPHYFEPNQNESEVIFKIHHNDYTLFQIKSVLKTLLESNNAESLLFDSPKGATPLFEVLIRNKEYYPVFIELFEERPQFSKLVTIERLNQCVVNVEDGNKSIATTSVMATSMLFTETVDLLIILLIHNPSLRMAIHQQNMLYKPSKFTYPTKSCQLDLLSLLFQSEGMVIYLEQLITPEYLTPKFFNILFMGIHSGFSRLVSYESTDLLYSWMQAEPRMTDYLCIENLIAPGFSFKEPSEAMTPTDLCTFHQLLLDDDGFNILYDSLMLQPRLVEKMNLDVLCFSYYESTNPLTLLSQTGRGRQLITHILSCRKDWISNIPPEHVYAALPHLLCHDDGSEFVFKLMSDLSFVQKFNPEQLLPFSEESTRNCALLYGRAHGPTILKLLLEAHKEVIKKLSKYHLYDAFDEDTPSLCYLLLLMPNAVIVLHFIIQNNPSLVDDTNSGTAIAENIIKALHIQRTYKWVTTRPGCLAVIDNQLNQFYTILKGLPPTAERQQLLAQAEMGLEKTKQNSWANFMIEQELKNLLGAFTVENITQLLQKEKLGDYLFNSLPILGDKKQQLFEIILDNPTLLETLILALETDKFLASEALIHYSQAIGWLIRRLTTLAEPDELVIRLFDLLICNQPRLFTVNFITHQLLYRLSANEYGRHALFTMINHNPALFKKVLDSEIVTELDADWDWLSALMESRQGCSIIDRLYQLNKRLLLCFNPANLSKKSSVCDEKQIPIYYWLSATHAGQEILFYLLTQYPELVAALHEENLTRTIDSDDVLYDKTCTLFWLGSTALVSNKILELLDSCSTINNELLRTPVLHPYYKTIAKNSITSTAIREVLHTSSFKRGSIFVACCFLPVTYSDHSYGNHKAWTDEELDLIHELLVNLNNPKNKQAIKSSLFKILRHENAESLLFDHHNVINFLLSNIINQSVSKAIFIQILRENPQFYAAFTSRRLNQYVSCTDPNSMSSLLYMLLEAHPDILSLLPIKNLLAKSIDSAMLITPMQISKGDDYNYSLLNLIASNDKLIDLLGVDIRTLLSPEVITQLFPIKTVVINHKHSSQTFDFFKLFLNNLPLLTKMVNMEPRILNYCTEHHLTAMVHLPKEKAIARFYYLLASKIEGIKILSLLIDSNPRVLQEVNLEQMIKTSNDSFSTMYLLSRSEQGYKLLEKIISLEPEFFLEIEPIHLLEKPHRSEGTLFNQLCQRDPNISVLLHCMAQPSFIKNLKPDTLSIFFENGCTVFYNMCSSKEGRRLLDIILNEHTQALRKHITKDFLYRKNLQHVSKKSLFHHIVKGNLGSLSDIHLIYTIAKVNPAIANCTREQFFPLTPEEVVANTITAQLNYENSGLLPADRSFLKLWLTELTISVLGGLKEEHNQRSFNI